MVAKVAGEIPEYMYLLKERVLIEVFAKSAREISEYLPKERCRLKWFQRLQEKYFSIY